MAAKVPPPLKIPKSESTVKISAIDTTLKLVGASSDLMWNPPIKGFGRVTCGTWSFLIEHPSGRKLLYDLGCRKDWEKLPPALGLEELVEKGVLAELKAEKNVDEILVEGGMRLEEVEGVIWSHWHFDHIGDLSKFPSNTKLIVGQGFEDAFLPGYPTDPHAHVLQSDFQGREVMEIDFTNTDVHIGRFKAFDYFGDGSLYILDSPGHAIGHINALARTHASPSPAFIHLCGDSVHHPAEIRPSEYLPLSETIDPSPVPRIHSPSCPGHVFSSLLRDGSPKNHILEFQDIFKDQKAESNKFALIVDEIALRDTVRKDEELDADRDIFTVIAHDWSLKGVIDEWPKNLNSWKENGWKEDTRWKFLEDFEGAVV